MFEFLFFILVVGTLYTCSNQFAYTCFRYAAKEISQKQTMCWTIASCKCTAVGTAWENMPCVFTNRLTEIQGKYVTVPAEVFWLLEPFHKWQPQTLMCFIRILCSRIKIIHILFININLHTLIYLYLYIYPIYIYTVYIYPTFTLIPLNKSIANNCLQKSAV